MAEYSLICGERVLDLSTPAVMGILNVTPDSFSDGGRIASVDSAVDTAAVMVADGARVLDIGGESTRPGADEVSESEEMHRVVPVIEKLAERFDVVLSIDTSKPGVIAAAVAAGAGLINDVRALSQPGSLQAAAETNAGICLMHMRGAPRTMQVAPRYDSVTSEIRAYLEGRVAACRQAGIALERLCVDPGYGFGKSLEHNLQLLAKLDEISLPGLPLLFGASRKSSIGQLLGTPVDDRLHGSVAMALLAVERGARIVRVHDVRPTVHALIVANAVRAASGAPC